MKDGNLCARLSPYLSTVFEVEPTRIGKTVLVIDEAQDMGVDEYALVKALMDRNEEMRVIAVGDDDQNIYEFRGSDSRYLYHLSRMEGSRFVEMTENYRSASHIVAFANGFAQGIRHRMKSTPIVSKRNDTGWVELTFYQSRYMYEPLVEQLLRCKGGGTSCVLTQTNEEAVVIAALLRKRGMNSKLIQSMDGFCFWNLAETRYFTFPVTFRYLWSSLKQRRGRDWTNGQEQGRRLRWQDFRPLLRKAGIPPGKQKLGPGQQNPD